MVQDFLGRRPYATATLINTSAIINTGKIMENASKPSFSGVKAAVT
jgi:hypothetical protein